MTALLRLPGAGRTASAMTSACRPVEARRLSTPGLGRPHERPGPTPTTARRCAHAPILARANDCRRTDDWMGDLRQPRCRYPTSKEPSAGRTEESWSSMANARAEKLEAEPTRS